MQFIEYFVHIFLLSFALGWLGFTSVFAFFIVRTSELGMQIGLSIFSLPFVAAGLVLLFYACRGIYTDCWQKRRENRSRRENISLQNINVTRLQEAQKEISDKKKEIEELQAELVVEREEFKKFQDKSIEYQKKREAKIRELEAKIIELVKNEDITIPLEEENIYEYVEVGTSY